MTAEEKQAWPEIPEVKPITVGYEHIEKLTDLLLDNYDDRLNKLEARAGAIAERLEKLETLTTYSNDGRFSDLSQRITTWTERIKELETCVREICIPSKGVSVFDLVESLQRVDIRLGEHIRAGLVRVEKLEENRDDMCKRLFALEQADVMQDDLANRMTFRESPMSEPETQEETTANEEKLVELHRLAQEKRQQAEFDRLQDELLPHERRP